MNREKIVLPGIMLNFNGQILVPEKVFGVHGFPMKKSDVDLYRIEMSRAISQKVDGNPTLPGSRADAPENIKNILECIYDRYQPALILERADWKEKLLSAAANFAKARNSGDFPQIIEFWNEPYLNWADRPGVNYDPRWFEKMESGQIKIKTTGEIADLLEETKQMLAVRKDNGLVHYLASRYTHDYRRMGKYQGANNQWFPFKWEEGFEFDFRGLRCVLKNLPWFKDKTQKSYYSSEFNSKLYRQMLLVFAEELKKNAPEIKVAAGWGCNMWWDDWTPWKVLYKPIIDEAHHLIDGICEHHYGCDVRMVAAQYEIAYTYAITNYGKSLKFYNTEVGGGADPEQPGKFIPFNSGALPLQNMTYALREIMHMLCYYPDKIETMAFHEPQYAPGVLDAFLFLKELRGRLLHVECDAKKVWTIASLENNKVCLVIFNDNNKTIPLMFEACAPGDTSIVGAYKNTYEENEKKNICFVETKLETKDSKCLRDELSIPKFSAVKYLIELDRAAVPEICMRKKQYFAKDILVKIEPDAPKKLHILIPESELRNAKFAKLRIVHSGISSAQTKISVNDTPIDIDIDGEYWTSEVSIPLELLRTENTISFEASGNSKGFLLAAASVYLFARQ